MTSNLVHRWIKKYKKKKIFKKIAPVPILSLLIALIAFSYALSLTSNSCLIKQQWCGQDMDQYMDYSDNLLSGHGYTAKKVSNMYFVDPLKNTEYIPEVLRLPAYPLLLTLGRLIYNEPVLVLFYNFFFYAFILFYSFKILREFLVSWLIPLAFLLVAFNPTLLFYTAQMGSADTFATFALVGFVYHTLQIYKNQHLRRHAIIASFLGVAAVMTRQNILLFILPFLTLPFFPQYRESIKTNGKNYIVIVLGIILLVMSIWIVRNYVLTGKPVISGMSGMQLFSEHVYFATEATDSSKKAIAWLFEKKGGEAYVDDERKNGKSIDQAYVSLDSYVNTIAITHITSDLLRTLYHYKLGIASFYTGSTFTWDKEDFLSSLKHIEKSSNFMFLFTFPLFPLLYFLKKRKDNVILLTMWVSSFLFIYLSAFFHGTIIGNRGLLPVFTIQIVICSLLFSTLLYKIVSIAKGYLKYK